MMFNVVKMKMYDDYDKDHNNYFDSDDSYNFFCFSQSLRSFLYVLLLIFSPLLSCDGIPRNEI